MKKLVALALAACALAPAFAQTNVGVSIGVYQPGVYGRIDIGNFPQPQVIYPQPVIIHHPPVAVYQQPVYLYVPPGHQKNWRKHCSRYNACGQPVYFVQERWIRDRYDERHGHDDRRDDRYDGRRDDRGDFRHDNGHGRDKHGKDDRGRHGRGD
ncbi:MAG TPA: hypothetical protein PKX82_11055 [Rhodoferax sp.]|nr:hypothetical protein [Rhodoferax sp.]